MPGHERRALGSPAPPAPARDAGESDRLLALQREIARGLGYPAPEPVHSAGVTDGSLTAAAGVPTLDSLGVRGGGAHTDREFVRARESLRARGDRGGAAARTLAREAERASRVYPRRRPS